MAEHSTEDGLGNAHQIGARGTGGMRESTIRPGTGGNLASQMIGARDTGGLRESTIRHSTVGNLASQMKQVRREEFDNTGNDGTGSVTSSSSSLAHTDHGAPYPPAMTPLINRRQQFAFSRRDSTSTVSSSVESAGHIIRRKSGQSEVYRRSELRRSTAALDLPPL